MVEFKGSFWRPCALNAELLAGLCVGSGGGGKSQGNGMLSSLFTRI